MVDDKQLNESAQDKLAREKRAEEGRKKAMQRRQSRIIQPSGFAGILTGTEDTSGFGDVFDESMPARVQKIAEWTWDECLRRGSKSIKEPWRLMKIAKPEILNAHMRYILAYLKVGNNIEKAVREVSNGRYGAEDLPKNAAEHQKLLAPLVEQAKHTFT